MFSIRNQQIKKIRFTQRTVYGLFSDFCLCRSVCIIIAVHPHHHHHNTLIFILFFHPVQRSTCLERSIACGLLRLESLPHSHTQSKHSLAVNTPPPATSLPDGSLPPTRSAVVAPPQLTNTDKGPLLREASALASDTPPATCRRSSSADRSSRVRNESSSLSFWNSSKSYLVFV